MLFCGRGQAVRSCVTSGAYNVLRVCGAVSSSGTGGARFRSWSLKRCCSLVSHCHVLELISITISRIRGVRPDGSNIRSASGVSVAKFSVSVSKVSAQQLYISKRPAESAACSQMATSLLSPPNLSVAEVSAQCVFLAVESCRVHGKRFDGNIAPSGSASKVADLPRSIGKLIKGIDDTLPDNNIITVDAESIGLPKLLHSQCS